MYLEPIIEEIARDENNPNIMIVSGGVVNKDINDVNQPSLFPYSLSLDIEYMGIDYEGDFEKELYRDIRNAMNTLYKESRTYPSNHDIESIVSRSYYHML